MSDTLTPELLSLLKAARHQHVEAAEKAQQAAKLADAAREEMLKAAGAEIFLSQWTSLRHDFKPGDTLNFDTGLITRSDPLPTEG